MSDSSSLCAGSTATLTASGAHTYTWSTQDTSAVISVTPTVTTLYTVIGADANGCSNLATITEIVKSCNTTDIKQSGIHTQVFVYPNPACGTITIEPSNTEKQTLNILDVNGKLNLSQMIRGKTTIDVSSLTEGVYTVSMISQGSVVNTRIVIIK